MTEETNQEVSQEETPAEGEVSKEQGDKYKTIEEAEKANTEAQRKISEQAEELKALKDKYEPKTKDDNEENTEGEDNESDTGEVSKEVEVYGEAIGTIVAEAGLTFDDIQNTFDESGDLAEEQYEALTGTGKLSREMVEAYVAGVAGQRDKLVQAENTYVQSVVEAVGGDDTYTEMQKWMQESLTKDEQEKYTALVTGEDREKGLMAAQVMAQRFKASDAYEPTLVKPGGKAIDTTGTYKNKAEYQADIKTEAYRKDPKVRSAVDKKLERSNYWKNN